jgi:hypothetical protein
MRSAGSCTDLSTKHYYCFRQIVLPNSLESSIFTSKSTISSTKSPIIFSWRSIIVNNLLNVEGLRDNAVSFVFGGRSFKMAKLLFLFLFPARGGLELNY